MRRIVMTVKHGNETHEIEWGGPAEVMDHLDILLAQETVMEISLRLWPVKGTCFCSRIFAQTGNHLLGCKWKGE